MNNTRTVTLPAEICELAERRFGTNFANLDDWVTMVLKELLLDETSRIDETEQSLIEERLKALGYL